MNNNYHTKQSNRNHKQQSNRYHNKQQSNRYDNRQQSNHLNSNHYNNSRNDDDNTNISKKKELSGPLSKIRNTVFIPCHDFHQSSQDGGKIEEVCYEYLYVREISPNGIYDFRISQNKFCNLLRSQDRKNKGNKIDQRITDRYHLYHYVISYQLSSDGLNLENKVVYSSENLETQWIHDKNRYKIKNRLTYFNPDDHDLDTYLDYHLITRIISFHFGNFIFEICIDCTENNKFNIPSNIWFKLLKSGTNTDSPNNINNNDLTFPHGTTFTVRKVNI